MNKLLRVVCFALLAAVGVLLADPKADSSTTDPNHYASELVNIPAGSFRMGSDHGDRDERPVHTVNVPTFQIGRSEVTLGWYLRCMADSVCEAPSWWPIGYFEDVPPHLTPTQRSNLPVTGVSWRQAKLFCKWLGVGYDLPSEAEWEYVAGAGQNWKYPWGNHEKDRFHGVRPRYLTPVVTATPNPLGVYGVGLVWEWVSDCYEADKNGVCIHRTTKGGSWSELIWNLRVANKSYGLEDEGYKGLGFRVVYHAP